MEKEQLKNKYLEQVFQYIQDGIIIMDHDRNILMMNPSAKRLTGWDLGERVPFCSFCEKRAKEPGEHICYLIEHNEVPYFMSKMPTYFGSKIDVEMSAALMPNDGKTNKQAFLLVLRDQTLQLKEEEARISKLIIKKLIEAKEEEHKRLAQELHDGVGQSLYTISVALQAIESFVKDNEKLNIFIEEVRTELEKVMKDVQVYSHQLRPHSIDQFGITPTIRTLVESVQKVHPHISFLFEANFQERCNSSVEINVYRVVQEALHNSIKYAQASKVFIRLEIKDNHLVLCIEDDGVGFDPQFVKKEGLGLKHMEERITMLGGSFQLKTAPAKGTHITIQLPHWKDDDR